MIMDAHKDTNHAAIAPPGSVFRRTLFVHINRPDNLNYNNFIVYVYTP